MSARAPGSPPEAAAPDRHPPTGSHERSNPSVGPRHSATRHRRRRAHPAAVHRLRRPSDAAQARRAAGRRGRPGRGRHPAPLARHVAADDDQHRRHAGHRHLRGAGQRRAPGRPGRRDLLHPRGRHRAVLGAVLRRARRQHPGLRLVVLVRLRHPGRDRRLDLRLVPDPRVRRLRRGRRRRLGAVPQRAPRGHDRRHHPGLDGQPARRGRRRLQPARPARRAALHGLPAGRRQGERPRQRDHGRREDRGPAALLRRGLHRHQGRQLRPLHAARPRRRQRRGCHAVLLVHRLRRRLHRR